MHKKVPRTKISGERMNSMEQTEAILISLIVYHDQSRTKPEVRMIFADSDGKSFFVNIYNQLRSKGIFINQRMINNIQAKLQGQKFIIYEDGTVFQLMERINDCRA